MDDDGDWITARYLLSSILGRNPLVMDYVDEESFPVDPPPAAGGRAAAAPAISAPPAVSAPAGVAGTVCSVCTEEIAVADAAVRLPCAHWYHAGCIAPWLGIRSTCPMCRAELPPRENDAAGREKPRARAGAAAGASVAGTSAGANARARRDASSYEYLAGGVLSG
uniref:RING-type domain-containing protein n=1 Tax=Arundo donax TaxID=35708 RepID=A0A0A9CVG5_ARUDO